jgi:hypothetical protein
LALRIWVICILSPPAQAPGEVQLDPTELPVRSARTGLPNEKRIFHRATRRPVQHPRDSEGSALFCFAQF